MTQHYHYGALVLTLHTPLNKRLLLNDQTNHHGAYVQPLYEKLDTLVFNDELGYTALLPLLEVVLVMTRGNFSLFKGDVDPLTGAARVDIERKQRTYCAYLSRFLFTGTKGELMADRGLSRVSIKTLVLNILAALTDSKLKLSQVKISEQRFDEIIMFKNHSDPGLRCSIVALCAALITNHDFEPVLCRSILLQFLHDESSQVVVRAIGAINQSMLSQDEELVRGLVRLSQETSLYVSVKLELMACLSRVQWRHFDRIDYHDESAVFAFFAELAQSNDQRQRAAAADSCLSLLRELYGPCHLRQSHVKIIAKCDIELDSLLSRQTGFDCALEHYISHLGEVLLRSLNSHAISGLSTVLLRLHRAYPRANSWQRLGPKLLSGYLIQVLEMGVDMVEWSQQADVLLLTSELLVAHCDAIQIQKRYVNFLLKTLNIIKCVFTDRPYADEAHQDSATTTPSPTSSAPSSSSPSIARRFRKLLPSSSNSEDKKDAKEVSELPNKTEHEHDGEINGHLDIYQKLKTAYVSAKIKANPDLTLTTYCQALINAVKVVLPSLSVQLISKVAQDLLGSLQAIYDKSFDSIAASIISCVGVLLESLFGVNANKNESNASSSITQIADFAIKVTRPFDNYKNDIPALAAPRRATRLSRAKINALGTGGASSSQDFIRWFEPFVNIAMKRYTVTANGKIQLATISLLQTLVGLRVNYSLLDHDGVFLKVLRSQIEFAEKLIWRDCTATMTAIFEFLVAIADDSNKGTAQVRRNEIITWLSTLQAAGLELGQLLKYMAPIVYDVFDERAKGDLDAEREMLLSMLMKMTSNGACVILLNHCIRFYANSDQVAWRASSARICRHILLACVPTHYNASISGHFSHLDALLFSCSNGSLIQNEKLVFDALAAIDEALNSPLCTSHFALAQCALALIGVTLKQNGMLLVMKARHGMISSSTSTVDLLRCVLSHVEHNQQRLLECIFLLRIAKEHFPTDNDNSISINPDHTSPIVELMLAVNHQNNQSKAETKLTRLASAITTPHEAITDEQWPVVYQVSRRSEKVKQLIESTVKTSEDAERVIARRLEQTGVMSLPLSEELFILSIMPRASFLAESTIKRILTSRRINCIKLMLKLLNNDIEHWASLLWQVVDCPSVLGPVKQRIRHLLKLTLDEHVKCDDAHIRDIINEKANESRDTLIQLYIRIPSYRTRENFLQFSHAQKRRLLPLLASPLNEWEAPPATSDDLTKLLSHQSNLSVLDPFKFIHFARRIVDVLKTSFDQLTQSHVEQLIDDLVRKWVVRGSDDKMNDLIESVQMHFANDNVTDELIVTGQLLALLSHHPAYVVKMRLPRRLSSFESAHELEDSIMLKSVLFRFQLLGYGNRACFLQLWTSLQQLICAQSITGLEVGSGGEEETEVACLAVRGLTSLLLSASAVNDHDQTIATTNDKLLGCPVVSQIKRHSRSTTPRLTGCIPTAALRLHRLSHDRLSSLFLCKATQEGDVDWLTMNVEEIGSSVSLIDQINSPAHFRRLGISPLVTLKQDQAAESVRQQDQRSAVWRPDLESSVQFLFDLFLRWIHFTQCGSDESPASRVIVESLRALSILVNFYPTRQHFHDTNNCLMLLIDETDPVTQRLILPTITKCAAIAGFDHEVLETKILPLLTPTNRSLMLALFHLIDTPAGLVQNFDKIIRRFVDAIEQSLLRANPSWLSCTPHQLEQKIIQFSAGTFIIERFADYAEEAGFTQNLVNYAIRVLRFGLPTRALVPFSCALARLVWLGHLVPQQLHKISQAGGELCSSRSDLAQCGVSLITTVVMYLNLIRQRTVSFMDNDSESSNHGEIASQFQSTVSLLLSSIDTYNTGYAKHTIPLIYTINRQLGASCLNKVLIEFMTMSKPNMSLYAHFVYASFSIGNDTNSSSTVERNKSNAATTRPNQWVILTVPNIIQIDSLKRITRILSVLFIATLRDVDSRSLLPVLDYMMSYDSTHDETMNADDWAIFVHLGRRFLKTQSESNAADFCSSLRKLAEKKQTSTTDAAKIHQIISSL